MGVRSDELGQWRIDTHKYQMYHQARSVFFSPNLEFLCEGVQFGPDNDDEKELLLDPNLLSCLWPECIEKKK